MLFDYLVLGHVLPTNPASAVRGPKHVVKKGMTPVLSADEARTLLDSLDITSLAGLRDRAFIAVMVFSFARVSAVIDMNVQDYFPQGKRFWFRLTRKAEAARSPRTHKAEEYLDAYLAAAGITTDRVGPSSITRPPAPTD